MVPRFHNISSLKTLSLDDYMKSSSKLCLRLSKATESLKLTVARRNDVKHFCDVEPTRGVTAFSGEHGNRSSLTR